MTTLRTIFIVICITLFSCNNSAKKINTEENIVVTDTATISNEVIDSVATITNVVEGDTITTIKFKELSVAINRLVIYDEANKIDQIQKDSVEVYAEVGETIEGQLIAISSDELIGLTVEQRYETSVTIMNEGPHCDLTEWEHFYSDWKQLPANNNSCEFICDKYTEKEYEKFPKIVMEALKQKVKLECGEEWYQLVKKINKPTEYPSGVSISRYYLRISGQRKDNGQTVTKLIVVATPMGC
ncbi:MAG: hypothetical protein PSV16_05480 [Flavobacterium sp.]|nr:hypothetical protein [Flavobacterium sp.]